MTLRKRGKKKKRGGALTRHDTEDDDALNQIMKGI